MSDVPGLFGDPDDALRAFFDTDDGVDPDEDPLTYLRALLDGGVELNLPADQPQRAPANKISFGAKADPVQLIGRIDPLDGTPLAPGEDVAVCERCGVAYHITTLPFIRQRNAGKCVACRTITPFQHLTLPGGATPSPLLDRKPLREVKLVELPPEPPTPDPSGFAQIFDAHDRPIIRIGQVLDFIGQEVAFEGEVVTSHITQGGAIYLYFHQPRRVLDGFRGTIRPQRMFDWQIEGIVPATDYTDRWVRMIGTITNHQTFGLQMLLGCPEAITVIDAPTPLPTDANEPVARSRPVTASDHRHPANRPRRAASPEPAPAPVPHQPRIRWPR